MGKAAPRTARNQTKRRKILDGKLCPSYLAARAFENKKGGLRPIEAGKAEYFTKTFEAGVWGEGDELVLGEMISGGSQGPLWVDIEVESHSACAERARGEKKKGRTTSLFSL